MAAALTGPCIANGACEHARHEGGAPQRCRDTSKLRLCDQDDWLAFAAERRILVVSRPASALQHRVFCAPRSVLMTAAFPAVRTVSVRILADPSDRR
jgi:hypothetical protein